MAKTFQVTYDDKVLQGRGKNFQKNLAFSTAQAVNKTALEVQRQMRIHIDRTFQVRQAGFIYRLIKIFTFASATQGRPFAEVGVDNSKERTLLGLFEEGGERLPQVGGNVAVPITGEEARPAFGDRVVSRFRFPALAFTRSARLTKSGQPIWLGKAGAYLIPGVGVFLRVAKGASHLIYAFKHSVKVKPVLKLAEISAQVYQGPFFVDTFTKIFNARKP